MCVTPCAVAKTCGGYNSKKSHAQKEDLEFIAIHEPYEPEKGPHHTHTYTHYFFN